MACYAGKTWTREELLSYVGDPLQVAGARCSILADGKADGVRAVEVNTGGGLYFTVLPGRGMDLPFASYKGKAIGFFTGTGITAPGYYESQGTEWRRSFFGGLLTTCGITNAGLPSTDGGKAFGLHGRIANAAAENFCIEQEWEKDEFVIALKGTMREAEVESENITLTRRIETRLGAKSFQIRDFVVNRGFDPQPLMLLYHFNFGFPLLSSATRVVGPILETTPMDEGAKRDNGIKECRQFPEPTPAYQAKVFFHTMGTTPEGKTFVALLNRDSGNGEPLGVVMCWNPQELPCLCEWKMPRKGLYVVGLEPGTMLPLGRGVLRDQGKLPLLEGQASYSITLDVEVLDTKAEFEAWEERADRVVKKRGTVGAGR